ncbi:hypothetical protein D3C76_1413520 [compost metagenome]
MGAAMPYDEAAQGWQHHGGGRLVYTGAGKAGQWQISGGGWNYAGYDLFPERRNLLFGLVLPQGHRIPLGYRFYDLYRLGGGGQSGCADQ